MIQLTKRGDSIGARINVVAEGLPAGWGEPIFDRLDADIAHAMMGINAVKAVEIGAGFASVEQLGSEHRDALTPDGFVTNNAGGVLGGISSGQPIVVSMALKPTSSIRTPGNSVDVTGEPVEVVTTGRHDPCVGIRATPIAEAMLALVLIDHALRVAAMVALFWGAVDIVGASADELWSSFGAVVLGSLLVIGFAILGATLLITIKHRSRR